MRYFKKELWSQMNDSDEVIRSKAQSMWNENEQLYQQRLGFIKMRLPKQFMKEFLKRDGLHDYYFLNVVLQKQEKSYICELQLTNGEEIVWIKMSGLKMLQLDVASFQQCILGKLAWSYSEFDILSQNDISLSILCDVQNEMQFVFEKIKFISQKL